MSKGKKFGGRMERGSVISIAEPTSRSCCILAVGNMALVTRKSDLSLGGGDTERSSEYVEVAKLPMR